MSLPPAVHPLPGGAPEIADDIPAMIGGARQESAFSKLAPSCSPMLCGAGVRRAGTDPTGPAPWLNRTLAGLSPPCRVWKSDTTSAAQTSCGRLECDPG
jgi:hypothetical protein